MVDDVTEDELKKVRYTLMQKITDSSVLFVEDKFNL